MENETKQPASVFAQVVWAVCDAYSGVTCLRHLVEQSREASQDDDVAAALLVFALGCEHESETQRSGGLLKDACDDEDYGAHTGPSLILSSILKSLTDVKARVPEGATVGHIVTVPAGEGVPPVFIVGKGGDA